MQVPKKFISWIFGLAVVLGMSATISIAQAALPASQASQAPANETAAAACSRLADAAIPVNTTIEAKVTGLDSAHLKLGKETWFKVAHGVSYAGCTLDADAVVYARITSVSSSKNPNESELSLSFDRADCTGHDKQPFKLRLIGVVGPPDQVQHMHNDMPTQVAGKGRSISDAAAGTNALDLDLNPGGTPHTVHPGIVAGVPNLKLEPTAGPECSDRMTSTNSKIQLSAGSELILAVTETR